MEEGFGSGIKLFTLQVDVTSYNEKKTYSHEK